MKILYDDCIESIKNNKCSECNDFYQCSVCDYVQQQYEKGRADTIDECIRTLAISEDTMLSDRQYYTLMELKEQE